MSKEFKSVYLQHANNHMEKTNKKRWILLSSPCRLTLSGAPRTSGMKQGANRQRSEVFAEQQYQHHNGGFGREDKLITHPDNLFNSFMGFPQCAL